MYKMTGEAELRRPRNELMQPLLACRSGFFGIALFSCVLNVLFLTGSFYMLEVYDRVLPSGSVPTLIGLALIATILYLFQGLIDVIRARLLARIGTVVDSALNKRTMKAVVSLPLMAGGVDSIQPSRDLDALRSFLSSPGPTALFDLPWMPIYLVICFAFHPAIGWTATLGGFVLIVLALCTELMSRGPVEQAYFLNRQRHMLSEVFRRNAEVLRAMGMEGRLGETWSAMNDKLVAAQQRCADVSASLGSLSRVTRMMLQSAVLTVGAYLVINGEATGGIIIASSILSSRALAPVELAIAHWRSFLTARASWKRLSETFRHLPEQKEPMNLPAPVHEISVESLAVAAPGGRTALVQEVSFTLKAGDGLGIIGPSASGKSSLVRALVGAWSPLQGAIRLDSASIEHWSPDRLGSHIGYLPQELQLFPGTIAQNIARFDPKATSEQVLAAARAAGVHEMILRLPDGYETSAGENGMSLSVGQRQRIGLARALFGNPFLVVLDEPNSNLDADGEAALTQALIGVRERGGIALVVAHRPSALTAMNLVLMLADGRMQAFGDKDDILRRILAGPPTPVPLQGQIDQRTHQNRREVAA